MNVHVSEIYFPQEIPYIWLTVVFEDDQEEDLPVYRSAEIKVAIEQGEYTSSELREKAIDLAYSLLAECIATRDD